MTRPVIAKYVRSNLVASFSKANPPVIWTFDLARNHSFTLAIQGRAGTWELSVTSFKGESDVIARFDEKEDVEAAFHSIQKILMKGRRSFLGRIFTWGLSFLVIVALLLALGIFAVKEWAQSRTIASSDLFPPHPPAKMEEGIPLPADDVLKPPP